MNASVEKVKPADQEYVLELGSNPNLHTLVNQHESSNKSLLTKYRTSAIMTEAGSTRSIKFGMNRSN